MNIIRLTGIFLGAEQEESWAIGRLRFTGRGDSIQLFSQDPKILLTVPKITPVMVRGMLTVSPDGELQIAVKEIHVEPVKSARDFKFEGFNRMVLK